MPSATLDLDACIQIAKTTKQCLELRRQIEETKAKQEAERKQFKQIESHFHDRMKTASHRLERITNFNNSDEYLINYIRAAKAHFKKDAIILFPYILQKQAELIKEVRKQELLEVYIRVMEEQNQELISDMKKNYKNMVKGLKTRKKNIDTIRKEIYQLSVDKFIQSYTTHNCKKDHNNIKRQQQTLKTSHKNRQPLNFPKRRHINGIPTGNNPRVQLYNKNKKVEDHPLQRSLNDCADKIVHKSPLRQHQVTRRAPGKYLRI